MPALVQSCSDSEVWLQAAPRIGCVACAEGRGCGGGILGRLVESRREPLRLPRPDFPCAPGQQLWLRLEGRTLRQIALWTWGAPALGLLMLALALDTLPTPWNGVLALGIAAAAVLGPRRAARLLGRRGLIVAPRPLQAAPAACAAVPR